MGSEPWTIERISEALGNPVLAADFFGEINRAPAHELLEVFARWEQTAKDITAAVAKARELAAYDERGEEHPGEWIDVTQRVMDEAERIRSRRAA